MPNKINNNYLVSQISSPGSDFSNFPHIDSGSRCIHVRVLALDRLSCFCWSEGFGLRLGLLLWLVCACCSGGVCDVGMLPWKCCDVTEPVMTTPENVEGEGDTVLLCSWSVVEEPGCNYTEKHVQEPGNFKNFLPLKNPSMRFPPWVLHHGLNRGKVSGAFLRHEPWASFVRQRLRAFTPSKWLSCRVGFGDPGLLHLGLLFNMWRGGASL